MLVTAPSLILVPMPSHFSLSGPVATILLPQPTRLASHATPTSKTRTLLAFSLRNTGHLGPRSTAVFRCRTLLLVSPRSTARLALRSTLALRDRPPLDCSPKRLASPPW